MTEIHFDIETRSPVDIKKTGVYPYAEHPDTSIWCAAWAVGDSPVQCVAEDELRWLGREFRPLIKAQALVFAHNMSFERTLWANILTPRYGWPELPLEQCRCTMAMAYAMSLPGSLESAAGALGLDVGKDMTGRRLMLQMAKPRKAENSKLTWWDDDSRLQRLMSYCANDVEVERQLTKRLRPLSATEQKVWILDQIINDRGVLVDEKLCRNAKQIVGQTQRLLDLAMYKATGAAVRACTNVGELMAFVRSKGVDTDSLAKGDIDALLAGELPADVREALVLRREAGKAAVAKIDALLASKAADGRAKGLLQYHAASTGRWAGRRFQPQNIKRPELGEEGVEQAIDDILERPDIVPMIYAQPLSTVGDTLRGMVVAAPGKVIVAADFANIEGRVLAWLAGETRKLDAFRAFDAGKGPDLYKVAASAIYGVPADKVDKAQRQIGKVSELACGYQGGKGAFQKMAVGYGVTIPDEQAGTIVKAWREANPNIKQFWWDLEEAAVYAVTHPGTLVPQGPVRFKVSGSFLLLRLPSGRLLVYPYPQIEAKEMPWTDHHGNAVWKDSVAYKGVNSYTRKWEQCWSYGGLLAENITQAVARDILVEAMFRVEAAGYPIILTVHDEVVCEVDEDRADLEEFVGLLNELPAWAEGLPVASEGFVGKRYRK